MKKLVSIILCITMCLPVFSVGGYAEKGIAEEPTEVQSAVTEEAQKPAPEPESEPELEVEPEHVPEESQSLKKTDQAGDETFPAEKPEEEDKHLLESDDNVQPEAISVVFTLTPEDALLEVYAKDEQGEKTMLQDEEDGSWLLLPGIYYYDASAEEYLPVEDEEFAVSGDTENALDIAVELLPREADKGEPTAIMTTGSGTCGDNLNWNLDDSGRLTISGSGAMYDYGYNDNPAPWGASITSVVIGNSVTTIGRRAFSGCTSLQSVTIPESVTSIGDSAFHGCSLTSVKIPDSVTSIGDKAFYGCSLTSVKIPDSVTSIGGFVFSNCKSLTSVTIPDSVITIGEGEFYGCTNLTSITISNGIKFIGDSAFCWCTSLASIKIPESVTSIGDEAFSHCSSLTSVMIPDSVTTIGGSAFFGCRRLTTVTISGSVTSIEERTFAECGSLPSIIIPDNVTSIGYDAFSKCHSLVSVTIPDSLTSIERNAFSNCSNMISIRIPDSVTTIGDNPFACCTKLKSIEVSTDHPALEVIDSVLFSKEDKRLVCFPCALSDESYSIPQGYSVIGDRAFQNCKNLTSVTIPDSVLSIGHNAFSWCENLVSITIPDSVTTIGDKAFSDCFSLASVTIPDSVTSIGDGAFFCCSSLTAVTIPDSVTSIGYDAFDYCNDQLVLTVGRDSYASEYCVKENLSFIYPGSPTLSNTPSLFSDISGGRDDSNKNSETTMFGNVVEVAAGIQYLAALKSDGTVSLAKINYSFEPGSEEEYIVDFANNEDRIPVDMDVLQSEVSEWSDIESIGIFGYADSAEYDDFCELLIGLDKNGNLHLAEGFSPESQAYYRDHILPYIQTDEWTDVVSFFPCGGVLMGVRTDGSLYITGDLLEREGIEFLAENASDVVSIKMARSAQGYGAACLFRDGRLGTVDYNYEIDDYFFLYYLAEEVQDFDWSMSCYTVLFNDGTVSYLSEHIPNCLDIVQICCAGCNAYLVNQNGDVFFVEGFEGELHKTGLEDIKRIYTNHSGNALYGILGLKNDGSVVTEWMERAPQIDLSNWTDIADIFFPDDLIIYVAGLKQDGSLVISDNVTATAY